MLLLAVKMQWQTYVSGIMASNESTFYSYRDATRDMRDNQTLII